MQTEVANTTTNQTRLQQTIEHENGITAPIPTTNDKSPTAKAAADAAISDLDVCFGDPKLMIKGDGLNRVRPQKGNVIRFAFLPIEVAGRLKTAKSHFIHKKGVYRCLSKGGSNALCCSTGIEARIHVVGPVLRYTNADPTTGSLDRNQPIVWELAYIDMSVFNYRQVCGLPDEESDVYSIDLIMSHANRAFGYEFGRISSIPRWTLDTQVKAEVERAAKKMFLLDGGKRLASKLGKTATLPEWKALIASVTNGAAEASLEDVEGLE